MDLGIAGRQAIVCAASQGLGRACALALAAEGVNVLINARGSELLEQTASDIQQHAPGVVVTAVAGDITAPSVRQAILAAVPEPDILVNNAGGPPTGDFRDWDRDMWLSALDANMLSAIDLIRSTIDGMAARGFGRIVNITSMSVRFPIPMVGLSNAARAGLTNFVVGLAPSVSARGVTINNLLPGPFDTNRLRKEDEFAKPLQSNKVAGRVGRPAELGAMCAFVCSVHTGYMTGQNILIDGGYNNGNF